MAFFDDLTSENAIFKLNEGKDSGRKGTLAPLSYSKTPGRKAVKTAVN
jgi:hypothetical protein